MYREPHLQKKSDECVPCGRSTLCGKKHRKLLTQDKIGVIVLQNLVKW